MVAKILLQLDTDPQPSTFDAVVAIDSGVDHLLRHGGVNPENVTPLVHGAMFTRGGEALQSTAIFVGGSDVDKAEAVTQKVVSNFFGPVRVSVLQDANGCNTTAAAAVLCAARHVTYENATVCVLGGTGPVGKRVAEMVALEGGRVRLVSRSLERAQEAVDAIRKRVDNSQIEAFAAQSLDETAGCLESCQVVIACGAAGKQLLDQHRLAASGVSVAIDVNAVPPTGIEGIGVTDKAKDLDGVMVYGALGVGGLKMKIHRAAIHALFEERGAVMDAKEVLHIGKRL